MDRILILPFNPYLYRHRLTACSITTMLLLCHYLQCMLLPAMGWIGFGLYKEERKYFVEAHWIEKGYYHFFALFWLLVYGGFLNVCCSSDLCGCWFLPYAWTLPKIPSLVLCSNQGHTPSSRIWGTDEGMTVYRKLGTVWCCITGWVFCSHTRVSASYSSPLDTFPGMPFTSLWLASLLGWMCFAFPKLQDNLS